jgi:1,4-alpha-glucan branching enzyme
MDDLPNLAPALQSRADQFESSVRRFDSSGGLLGDISQGHRYFGLTEGEQNGVEGTWYREWAPGAHALSLIGDFNGWARARHPLSRDEFGVWSLFLSRDQAPAHGSALKVNVVGADGSVMDRIPAYARRVVQDSAGDFTCLAWWPPAYEWRNSNPKLPDREGLRIYETHVGMAGEEGRVGSFSEFEAGVLPRIKRLGYNAIQIMAIQEHPYYGSFGYHVSSYFAVSSRFGTPEQFKSLIDAAHGIGIVVLLDLVHSHAVKNVREGLSRFDGTDHQYFHAGPRGQHPAWDSLVFDYGKYEVQRFLLSNIRYWLEEFRVDGFRFDGVTSMLYLDHGLGRGFGYLDDYFGSNVDQDAVLYLQTANQLVHALREEAISIAEDVSGMPGIARPPAQGGIGFDYRLAMGIPDFWIKTLKERRDEDWSPGEIWSVLLNRRFTEKHVAYAESHDQALVGDKTLAFRLMDTAMYTGMSHDQRSLAVDRGLALHKLIRLLTFSLGGDAWLSFMGNEFGHPEWIDFPREGNNWSYHYARRQWSLLDNSLLYYQDLNRFDAALMHLDETYGVLAASPIELLSVHEDAKRLVYRRGGLVFAVNLNATESYAGLRIPTPDRADYSTVLSTDDLNFAGLGRAVSGSRYPIQLVPNEGRDQSIQIYLPSRTALVLGTVNGDSEQ